MRKFLITNSTFNGEAVLVFNELGLLVIVDISQTDMKDVFATWIYRNIPVQLPKFIEFLKSRNTGMVCVEAGIEVDFDMFWNKYGKKINKKRCQPLWNKLPMAKKVAAYYGIDVYEKFLKITEWRGKLDPENYLRDEMWENDWK